MRYVVIGFCVFAAACAGATPTGPTSLLRQIEGGVATTEAKGGSENSTTIDGTINLGH
jgi:hypothetical protein